MTPSPVWPVEQVTKKGGAGTAMDATSGGMATTPTLTGTSRCLPSTAGTQANPGCSTPAAGWAAGPAISRSTTSPLTGGPSPPRCWRRAAPSTRLSKVGEPGTSCGHALPLFLPAVADPGGLHLLQGPHHGPEGPALAGFWPRPRPPYAAAVGTPTRAAAPPRTACWPSTAQPAGRPATAAGRQPRGRSGRVFRPGGAGQTPRGEDRPGHPQLFGGPAAAPAATPHAGQGCRPRSPPACCPPRRCQG